MRPTSAEMVAAVRRARAKVEAGMTWWEATRDDPECYCTPEGVILAAKRLGLYRLSDIEQSKRDFRELADEMLENIERKRSRGIPLMVILKEAGLSHSHYVRAKDRARML